eukprot:Nk52_evm87s208 gene=Nk52_evmTU87s208
MESSSDPMESQIALYLQKLTPPLGIHQIIRFGVCKEGQGGGEEEEVVCIDYITEEEGEEGVTRERKVKRDEGLWKEGVEICKQLKKEEEEEEEKDVKGGKTKQRVVVICNPKSGKCQGESILEEIVKPIISKKYSPITIEEAGNQSQGDCSCVVVKTEHAGHAVSLGREVMERLLREEEEEERVLVVVIGGDGTVHEVLNGVYNGGEGKEEDEEVGLYRKKLQGETGRRVMGRVSMGVVPAGSGNALCATYGIETPVQAMMNVCGLVQTRRRGRRQRSGGRGGELLHCYDVSIEKKDNEGERPSCGRVSVVSFAVVSWGIHARLVNDAEALRRGEGEGGRWWVPKWLERGRFSYAFVWNLLFRFRAEVCARLRFGRVQQCVKRRGEANMVSGDEDSSSRDAMFDAKDFGIQYFVATGMRCFEKGFEIAPFADPSSPVLDVVLIRAPAARGEISGAMQGAMKCGGVEAPGHLTTDMNDAKYKNDSSSSPAQVVEYYRVRDGFVLEAGESSRPISPLCVDGSIFPVHAHDRINVREMDEELAIEVVSVPIAEPSSK